MKNPFLILLALLTMTLGAQHARAAESVVINNSSFELGTYNGANPWYGSTLDGWTINTPLANWVGKDDGTGPADNGLRPDRGHVVFLQAGFGNNSRIRQAITLDPSKTYCLQFWHNAAGAS